MREWKPILLRLTAGERAAIRQLMLRLGIIRESDMIRRAIRHVLNEYGVEVKETNAQDKDR